MRWGFQLLDGEDPSPYGPVQSVAEFIRRWKVHSDYCLLISSSSSSSSLSLQF